MLASMALATWVMSLLWGADPAPVELKRVGAGDAAAHYQETCLVTGKVAQVTIHEKVVYLNLEKPFPDSPFTGVIFSRHTNQFGNLAGLQGKQVEIKGKIEEYRRKPRIVLQSTNQLKVLELTAPAK